MDAVSEGLDKAQGLTAGTGYLELAGGLQTAGGLSWKAQAETGWHITQNQTLFAQVYAQPGDLGAMGGYRLTF